MSHPQAVPQMAGYSPQPPQTPVVPKRPVLLFVFLATTALAALSGIVGAILVYTGGNKMAESNMLKAVEQNPDEFGLPSGTSGGEVKELVTSMLGESAWTEMISEHEAAMSTRAGMLVFFGAWLLIAALCARNAARTARAFIFAGTIIALFPHMLVIADISPAPVMNASGVAMLLSPVILVLCWLPPNNRYAKARRTAR